MNTSSITRRELIKRAGTAALGFGLAGISGCAKTGQRGAFRAGEKHSIPSAGDWDPIFGPPIQSFSRYGGVGDFEGHLRGGAAPGVDYDIPIGTPLVPSMTSYLVRIDQDRNGSRFVLMRSIFHPPFQVSYGHLGQRFVDKRYKVAGDVVKYLGEPLRVLKRNEIIALSGNSGYGPREYGGVQPPHLHLSAFWDDEEKPYENLNPERYGPDGGRPIFWDGKTHLDVDPEKRLFLLFRTLQNFEEEMAEWPETQEISEVKGNLREFYRSLEGQEVANILSSKHFHDLRSYLKKATMEQKKFIPGTGPYSLMLKVVSYSTDPKQKVILTLPFIAAGLEKLYRSTVYEEGPFFHILPKPFSF